MIVVGSKNPAKIQAVQEVFRTKRVKSLNVSSKVSPQPFSDEETRQGSINRARQCTQIYKNVIGIGLEGGLMTIENQLFLCNWGALVTSDGKTYTAGGARILLPQTLSNPLKEGMELGEVIDDYAKRTAVSKHEGAIGILTNDQVSRKDMFIHIVQLLKGQWEYHC